MRFCLLALEEKPGTCIFISVVGIVIVWAPGPVREAGKSSILATVLYKRGRQKRGLRLAFERLMQSAALNANAYEKRSL